MEFAGLKANITCNGSECEDYFYTAQDFVMIGVQGVGLITVAMLGTFGNLLSVLVLFRMKIRQSPMNILLLGLSIYDLIWVISCIFSWGLPALFQHARIAGEYMTRVHPFTKYISYPIGYTAQTGSIYFTVLITCERYVAVCHPLKASYICRPRLVRIVAIVATLLTVAYDFSIFFEYKMVYNNDTMVYERVSTALKDNPTYLVYYDTWAYMILIFLLPFLTLLVLNAAIYKTMKRAVVQRSLMTSMEDESHSLTLMLFAVVITFFICNALYPVVVILEWIKSPIVVYFDPCVAFLYVLNSSVNFIYYFAFGKRFRKELRNLLSCSNKTSQISGTESTQSSVTICYNRKQHSVQ